MNRERAQALAAAIKESYRRLQFSEGPLRTIRETDALIDQLVAPFIIADMVERDLKNCEHPSWANTRLTTGDGTPVDFCKLCKTNRLS